MATRGINKVILLGNCGKAPTQKQFPSGGSVTNLTLATSESWKDRNSGESKERTEWHNLVFYNKLGEIVMQYVRKGSRIYVEGSLRTRKWTDNDNRDRYITEIVVNDMQMLDSRDSTGSHGSSGNGASQSSMSSEEAATAGDIDDMNDSDDLPF